MTGGYEGSGSQKKEDSETRTPSPSTRSWKLVLDRSMEGGLFPDDNTVYVRVEADGEVLGFLRLPDLEHVKFLRHRIQAGPAEELLKSIRRRIEARRAG